jgi:hypothetical protein
MEGDRRAAGAALRSAQASADALGDAYLRVRAALSLVLLELDEGETEHARMMLGDSLRLARQLTNPHYVAQALEAIAMFAAEHRHWANATQFAGAAAGIRSIIGAPLSPVERLLLDRRLGSERQDLRNFAVGQTWSMEAAVATALEFMSADPSLSAVRLRT